MNGRSAVAVTSMTMTLERYACGKINGVRIRQSSRNRSSQIKTRLLTKLLCTAAASYTMIANAQQPVCHNDGSRVDAAVCAREDFVRADTQLSDAYQAALSMVGADSERADARAAFVTAQREWIRFRDADCQGQDRIFQHGTMREAIVQLCLKGLTEQRTKELKQRWLP